ncbi:MAG: hypothetical protein V4733_06940 [Verrucomicrobiota bacterium]
MPVIKTLSLFAATALTASAALTLNYEFAEALTSSSTVVPANTLWALVVDDGNNTFAGFGGDDSLFEANVTSPGVADTFFSENQSIALGGVIGGGTIFALGGFTSSGATSGQLNLNLGENGLTTGNQFAFYWFPGATFTGGSSETIDDQVGGVHSSSTEGGLLTSGMVIPGDGTTESVGAFSVSQGGSTPNAAFTAVTLIPEPTTALLAAFGALGLLRRCRD